MDREKLTRMRRKLPSSLEKHVLVKNRHCCCICQSDGYGKDVIVHHIDGKNSNNVESNLAVLCLVHASQADAGLKKGKLGAGKKLKPDFVKQYKNIWERKIEHELQHRKKTRSGPDMRDRIELKRLKREALAASRRSPEDMAMFEQKVIEIDLLDGISSENKVSVFHDLGLEVALNSDRGTLLLIEYILWQLAAWDSPSIVAEIIESRKARKLLRHIGEILWDIGVNAVEYGRGIDVIRMITNAILEVKEKAQMINEKKAVVTCRKGLDNMLANARRDKRINAINILKHAITSFAEKQH